MLSEFAIVSAPFAAPLAELADHPLVGKPVERPGRRAGNSAGQADETSLPAELHAGMTCREFCFNNGL